MAKPSPAALQRFFQFSRRFLGLIGALFGPFAIEPLEFIAHLA